MNFSLFRLRIISCTSISHSTPFLVRLLVVAVVVVIIRRFLFFFACDEDDSGERVREKKQVGQCRLSREPDTNRLTIS